MNTDYKPVKDHYNILKRAEKGLPTDQILLPVSDRMNDLMGGIPEKLPYPVKKLSQGFQKGFYFNPSDEVMLTLNRTDSSSKHDEILKLPFDNLIINTDLEFTGKRWADDKADRIGKDENPEQQFQIDTIFVHSLEPHKRASTGQEIDPNENGLDGQTIFIHAVCHNIDTGEQTDIGVMEVLEGGDWDEPETLNEFLLTIVTNFLMFMNHPEVRYNTMERSEKNRERRKRKGKTPLPNDAKVEVEGELQRYFNIMENMDTDITHDHSYWVRGHWRTFHDEEYWGEEKVGEQTWIKPHIRGEGELIEDREYEVSE